MYHYTYTYTTITPPPPGPVRLYTFPEAHTGENPKLLLYTYTRAHRTATLLL